MTTKQYPYSLSDYQIQIERETLSDGSIAYVASVAEIDGLMAHGSTEREALENLRNAFEMGMDHFLKYGLEIPEPMRLALEPPTTTTQYSMVIGRQEGKALVVLSVIPASKETTHTSGNIRNLFSWLKLRPATS